MALSGRNQHFTDHFYAPIGSLVPVGRRLGIPKSGRYYAQTNSGHSGGVAQLVESA